MPKVNKKKRNNAASDAGAAAKAQAIFKMNTDIGQHVLKNPGIAEQ
jgi:18S rRNA (adenine1779-N6/adenine1780-N6)-dimethyltransferase